MIYTTKFKQKIPIDWELWIFYFIMINLIILLIIYGG